MTNNQMLRPGVPRTPYEAAAPGAIMSNFLGGHLNPVTFPPECKVPDDARAAVDPADYLEDYAPTVWLTNGRIQAAEPQVPLAR